MPFCCFGPKSCAQPARPAALGLSRVGQAGLQLWDPVAHDQSFCYLWPESVERPAGPAPLDFVVLGWSFCCFGPELRASGRSAALGLCVGHVASAPGVHPPTRGFRCGLPAGVSVVGPKSADLGVCNRASGEHRSCFSAFTVQGLRGEGRQRPRLLPRVL